MKFCVLTRARNQRGAAVVEFALISTLLITIVLGIISYGYMLSFRQAISQGAAEGARSAAVSPTTFTPQQKADAAQDAVDEALQSYGISCVAGNLVRDGDSVDVGDCTVVVATCDNNPAKDCAKVRLLHRYKENPLVPTFPGLGLVLPDALDYTAAAEVN